MIFRMRFLLLTCCVALFSCAPNNVTVDDSIEPLFKKHGVEGCFAVLDNGTSEITVYNLPRYRDSSFLPASTFKIVHSLIGLQTGIISSDSMVIPWDGMTRRVDAWNRDLNMYEAFRASSVPWYQQVARRIGRDTMQRFLDSLSYGTKKIQSGIDTFWLDNSLQISPDEQLGLAKRLYFDQLPFHKYNQQIVKNAMLFEQNNQYSLSFKTGLGFKENGAQLAWIVGWIVENKHPYFFVLNLESSDPAADLVKARMDILKTALAEWGFLKGNR